MLPLPSIHVAALMKMDKYEGKAVASRLHGKLV